MYCLECVCGKSIRSRARTGVCSNCNRSFEIIPQAASYVPTKSVETITDKEEKEKKDVPRTNQP